jgi:hypothetical protein
MKVQRKISSTTLVEVEGQSVVEVFEQLARLEEVFAGHETCGLCGKAGVHYEVQSAKQDNKYYKAVCVACGADFRFGFRKAPAGVLFPQLKDAEGKMKPNGGWSKWQPGDDTTTSRPPQPPAYQGSRATTDEPF